MSRKTPPDPLDEEDAGGFSNTGYLKNYFKVRREIRLIMAEEIEKAKSRRLFDRIYDV